MLFPTLLYIWSNIAQPLIERVESIHQPIEGKIKIVLQLSGQLKDSGTVLFSPVDYVLFKPTSEVIKPSNGIFSLIRNIDGATYVNFSDLLRLNKCGTYLTEPGDEVVISSVQEGFYFSGHGYEKYMLQYQLDSIRLHVPKPTNPKNYKCKSLDDYFDYENYLRNEFSLSLSLLKKYHGKISDFAFQTIKDNYISSTINQLKTKFYSLKDFINFQRIPIETLVHIYDTSYSKTVDKWLKYAENKKVLELGLIVNQLDRIFLFDSSRVLSKADKAIFVYKEAIKIYKGQERERFIVNYFPKQLMIDVGFIPEVEKLLGDYYSEPEYLEWKKWMKEQELNVRIRQLNHTTPFFKLTDQRGKGFTREDIKDKFAILHFWGTGSAERSKMIATIKRLNKQFKNYSNLVFVNISVDDNRDRWLKTVTSENIPGIHLYTNGEGANHEVIRQYAVTQYPTIWFLNPDGQVINANPLIDLTKDNGERLEELLCKYLIALPKDGPYVWHNDRFSIAYRIQDSIIAKNKFKVSQPPFLPVQTDLDNKFLVKLQTSLIIQPSEYLRPQKLLVLSDIEGNFDALRKLLQANSVIDQQYNWTFDKGHLVFAGDMFDRGNQVTECLWLLYSLEEKAKAAGGYVHFVLGNHEIMNMQGNHTYVQEKYNKNAKLLGKTIKELYNEDSELGRWLCTKNIMEKIGDLLFVHGGISHQVWRMNLTLSEMNELVRPYYTKAIDSSNYNLVILYGSKRTGAENSYTSPFWFRGYWGDIDNPYEIPTMKQVDSTLQKFGVNHIITGHTLLSIKNRVRYDGKVINVDTYHAKGKSDALLIDGNHFYRVDTYGQKELLFIDDTRKTMDGSFSTNTIKIE